MYTQADIIHQCVSFTRLYGSFFWLIPGIKVPVYANSCYILFIVL